MNATTPDSALWRPTDEGSIDFFNDAANLVGTCLTGFGYGIAFTLYCLCATKLWAQLQSNNRHRQALFMLVYTTVLIICGCLYFASAVRIVQDGYVTFRNFPGGPYAYTVFAFSTPDNYLGLVIYFLVNWMTDALLIWRVYVLFGGKRYPWAVILFPCVIYFASVAMGLVVIVEDSHTTESFWSALAIPFVLAYYVLTTSLTIICTILLTYRLLKARERYIQAMGKFVRLGWSGHENMLTLARL
ncbi:hypothetical protein AN958_11560 [Leucoagaricus sp. SymC.cos]|nr:hypothetical protein AN958_11560 [Leucoagaricus sp. SymC.cos]